MAARGRTFPEGGRRWCQSCSCDALGSSGESWPRSSLPGPAKNQARKRSRSQKAGINQLAGTHNFRSSCSLFGRASVLGSLSGGGGIWIQSSYFSSGLGEGGELLGHIALELICAEI